MNCSARHSRPEGKPALDFPSLKGGFLSVFPGCGGPFSRCAAQASHRGGLSCCGPRALEAPASGAAARGLSVVVRAQLPHSLWDLPAPGMEPLSPALQGGFLTTRPPGKAWTFLYFTSWAGFRADPGLVNSHFYFSYHILSLFKFFKGEIVIPEDSLHFFRETTFPGHPAFVPRPQFLCIFSHLCGN